MRSSPPSKLRSKSTSGAMPYSAPVENTAKELPGIAFLGLRKSFRRSLRHNPAATVTAFRAKINDPVGRFDHVQIMFDHQQRIAGRAQFEEDFQQFGRDQNGRSEEHTSELQSLTNLVCRLLLEKKKQKKNIPR